MRPVTDPSLTIPATWLGVWEGAAVIHGVPGLDYYADRRGVVTQRHHAEWAVWLTPDGDWPQTVITANERGMRLDLTHRQTRLEVMVRLAEYHGGKAVQGVRWERSESHAWVLRCNDWRMEWSTWNVPSLALLDLESQTVDIDALVAVCQHVWGS